LSWISPIPKNKQLFGGYHFEFTGCALYLLPLKC
jgi:hypothetical protein